ncbi:MAG: PEP-CTERM sorting domain-containing protein [Planctomycetia bacterium]
MDDPLSSQSLQFGNATFGWFASTKITPLRNDDVRSFRFDGWYTKGTFGTAFEPNPALVQFRVEFTQTGGAGNFVSTSATLEFAAQPVPEPTTLALFAMAIGTAAVVRVRRRKA